MRVIATTKKHQHKFAVAADFESVQVVYALPSCPPPGFVGFTSDWLWYGACPECGQYLRLEVLPINGKYSEKKKCDFRCQDATGHNCECQCGGKNHGESWQ